MTRRLVLNAVLRGQVGGHAAAWRVSSADVADVTTLPYWVSLAETLERARFDTLFFADVLALVEDPGMSLGWPLDPFVLITALAARTSDIGLVATHSTTFNQPYSTARQLASIDHLSGGRAGWNVVTSTSDAAAQNHGAQQIPEHDLRYRVADDYLQAVKKLWVAWQPDALVADRGTGVLVDPDAVRAVNHEGEFHRVRGPITTTRSPQTVPLIAQAGGSPAGIDLAGKHADLVYARQVELGAAQEYYARIKRSAVAHGRSPSDVLVLPGVVPVIGDTAAEALDTVRALREANGLERRLPDLEAALGLELSAADLDRPFPYDALAAHGTVSPLARSIAEAAPGTLRDVVQHTYGAFAESSGHRVVAGTAEQVAQDLAQWFAADAIDGVSVHVNVLPDDLDAFADRVVPLLQERGLVQTEYAPGTLRDKLGLPLPAVDTSGFTPFWPAHSRTPEVVA
ncbi:monooxygenase [Cellulomonas chitinilytica]|uniref:Monooxygenase n=1 Tax=Cellulomonas chitinilytica TaxID=398759 RepID=A0A919U3E3_9CELL|nr:NtaA/DmoA family FMN-dependent monooxygenase [Cellulomonas chitinilytica]GIG23226.1 monooxygenase [Cellulomonas chitinilytica]